MKKILIIGNCGALIDRLYEYKVYLISSCSSRYENVEKIDIREDNPTEILNFVLEYDIDFTIVVSKKAIKSDIVSIFQANDKLIFGPTENSAKYFLNKSSLKKLLYKLHMPISKFATFDKSQLALDYLQKSDYPLLIGDENGCQKFCCSTFKQAKYVIQNLESQNESMLIEDFVYGHNFKIYYITDGYNAIPLVSLKKTLFDNDWNFNFDGVEIEVQDNFITTSIQKTITDNVVLPILNYLQRGDNSYSGILAVSCVLNEDLSYNITDIDTFFSNMDAQATLNLIDENLVEVFESCANGSFSDEYDDILINDNFSVAKLVKFNRKFNKSEINDLIESKIIKCGENIVLTSTAKTISRAKEKLSDDIKFINSEE